MQFWDFVSILLRRWFVVIPALLIVAEAAFLVAVNIRPDYQAGGSLLLITPNPPSQTRTGLLPPANPYLGFNSSLVVAAGIVTRVVTTDAATIHKLREAGATADYTVTNDGKTPILIVTATGKNPVQTLKTVDVVSKGIAADLTAREQATGAPPDTWIRATILAVPDHATQLLSRPLRAAIAVAGLGIAAVVLLTFALEGFLQRRARRRARVLRSSRTAPEEARSLGSIELRSMESQQ
jgi:hypothetical protein